MRWVTRVSGFHVVRPVVKLANGTYLVGEPRGPAGTAPGAGVARPSTSWNPELSFATVRGCAWTTARVVTRGTWVENRT
jgi:hypothetical protein